MIRIEHAMPTFPDRMYGTHAGEQFTEPTVYFEMRIP